LPDIGNVTVYVAPFATGNAAVPIPPTFEQTVEIDAAVPAGVPVRRSVEVDVRFRHDPRRCKHDALAESQVVVSWIGRLREVTVRQNGAAARESRPPP
jgi:hypothetical protein